MNKLLIVFLFLLCQNIFGQDLENCMLEHISYVDLEEEAFKNCTIKYKKGEHPNFILSGEIHTIWESDVIRFQFLKHLNQKMGFNHLLLEEAVSKGYVLNLYLETGEEVYLEQAYPKQEDDVINKRNQIRKEHFQTLYKNNGSLPFDQKIKILAVDIERHGNENIVSTFKDIIAKDILLENEKIVLNQLTVALEESSSEKKFKKTFNQIYASDEIRALLSKKKSYDYFIILSILRGLKFRVDKKPFRQRDEFMFQTFTDYHQLNPANKYFYQIGLNHIKTNKDWFTNYILNDQKIKPVLIQYEYFGFENNFYGNAFKKGETASLDLNNKHLDAILKTNTVGLVNAQNCKSSQEVDYYLLIRNSN